MSDELKKKELVIRIMKRKAAFFGDVVRRGELEYAVLSWILEKIGRGRPRQTMMNSLASRRGENIDIRNWWLYPALKAVSIYVNHRNMECIVRIKWINTIKAWQITLYETVRNIYNKIIWMSLKLNSVMCLHYSNSWMGTKALNKYISDANTLLSSGLKLTYLIDHFLSNNL